MNGQKNEDSRRRKVVRLLGAFLGMLLIFLGGIAGVKAQPEPLKPEDFCVGKVCLGTEFNTLKDQFEPPLVQTERRWWGADGRYHVTWKNDTAELSVIEMPDGLPVSRAKVTDGQYPTPRGIRVGDTREDVERQYGAPHMTVQRDGERRLIYNRTGRPNPYVNSLVFCLDPAGKITAIAFYDAMAE